MGCSQSSCGLTGQPRRRSGRAFGMARPCGARSARPTQDVGESRGVSTARAHGRGVLQAY
jgi:hypothetical protein